MTERQAPTEATGGTARRDFLKLGTGVGAMSMLRLGAGAGALSMLNACANEGTEDAAMAGPGDMTAGMKDAEEVFWEMPQRDRPPISVDVHAHWSPPVYTNAQADAGRGRRTDRFAPGLVRSDDSLMDQLNNNIHWMDERAMQAVIWTLNGGKPGYWLSPAESAREAALVNDAGIEAYQAFPERMFLGAEIPARNPELSLQELNRVAGNPAVKGLALPLSMTAQDYIFDPAFEPVLARAEELGLPLLFHPLNDAVNDYGGTQSRLGRPQTDDAFVWNTLGFPWDTATVAAKLITYGTLDKFPKLQAVLPHAGGVFPYIAGRIQHGIERRKFPLKRPFRDYVRQNFWFDTMTYYPEVMRFLIEFAGVDRIMVGTDNGYNSSARSQTGRRQARNEWPNSIVEYMELPADQEEAILRGNAVSLFRL